MKTLFILISLLIPGIVSAGESCQTNTGEETVEDQMVISTDVPKFLEGATIIVRTKDGRESSVPAEKFKVVPRKQQFIVSKTKQSSQTVCKADSQKNRLSVMAGNGPQNKLDVKHNSNKATIESHFGTVGGLQYQRQTDLKVLDMPVSGGIILQSNDSVLGVVGLDF